MGSHLPKLRSYRSKWKCVRCAICDRVIEIGFVTRHHLIPKSEYIKGTNKTIKVHHLCHAIIHALFTNEELASKYCTKDLLCDNELIRAAAVWVMTLPNERLNRRQCGKGTLKMYGVIR